MHPLPGTAEPLRVRRWLVITALIALAAVLYALGWVIAKAFGVVWLAVTWCAAAVQIGWEEARTPARAPADGGS